VTLFVIEAGSHVLADGKLIDAGSLSSSKLSPQGFEQPPISPSVRRS
jgi:hypothetical protein